MAGEFIYANGLKISQSRQIFRFVFGDFFIKADKNDARKRFDVFLRDKMIVESKGVKKVELLKDAKMTVNGISVNILEYFKSYYNETDAITGSMKKDGYFNIVVLKQE